MTLYEITGEFRRIADLLDELAEMEADLISMEKDKDISREELESQQQIIKDTQVALDCEFEIMKDELETKAEGYIAVINEYDAQAKIFKQERDKWDRKFKAAESSGKRLTKALFDAMVVTGHDGKEGLDTGLHKLKVVNNGGVQPLKIDIPPEELPPIFQKVEIKADTDKIRGMLAKGEEVTKEYPWAHLEPRGRHLSIK